MLGGSFTIRNEPKERTAILHGKDAYVTAPPAVRARPPGGEELLSGHRRGERRPERNVINRKLLIKEFSIYFNLDKWFPSREFMSKTPDCRAGRERQEAYEGRVLAGKVGREVRQGRIGR